MNKEIKTITEQELLTILMNVEKPTFTSIVSTTSVKMKKTDNPYFDKIVKKSKGTYFIGGSYEDMVNTRCVKEGIEPNFESEECSVGQHVSKCVQYNENHDRHYLQYFTFPTSKIKSEFYFEGNTIEKTLFEQYMNKVSTTSRQPQENKHDVKSFKISSIDEITLNGTHYIVER
jgi:hypothetical protein